MKKEWKNLFQNKFLLIVLVAIITIPTIYTTFFLASMWDPYGKVSNLPVAVVNNDVEVEYNNTTLSVGQSLVDALLDNESMAFNEVNATAAEKGLENGTYYMIITIPEDFSQKATTLLEETPEKMELSYETNPGTNYIASKMSESALTKVQTSIADEVTAVYAESVFDQLGTIGDGFTEAADGSSQILDGQTQLADGNQTITDNLNVLADSSLTFSDGADELSVGIKNYTDGVATLNTGIKTASKGIDTFSESVTSGTDQLKSGSKTLKNGVKSYTEGVAAAYSGAQTLTVNNEALNNGMDTLSTGVDSLKTGSSTLLSGLNTLSSTLGAGLTEEKTTQITQLEGGLTAINEGIQNLNTSVQNMDAGSVTTDLKNVQTSIRTLSTVDQSGWTDAQKEAWTTLVSSATATGTDLTEMTSSLKTNVATLAAKSDVVLPGSKTALATMSTSLANVQTAVDGQIIPGMNQIDSGLTTVQTGISGDSGLKNGVKSYTSGVSSLEEGLKTLDSNSETLVEGAKTLNTGIKTLSSGISEGIDQLANGTDQLKAGSKKLVKNNTKLTDGAAALKDGAVQIADGSGKLAEGSTTLGDGITELMDGTTTLTTSLADAATEVTDTTSVVNDDTISMFSSPVDATGTQMTTVENNGHAMAAYMMVVGLWVGCLAFCLVYPLKNKKNRGDKGISLWAGKASVMYLVVSVAACAMVGMLHVTLGFTPAQMGQTLLTAVLTGICFMSIMYFFNVVFGKIGSYLMLIFMVLQLSGSLGTYPVELSGDYVETITNLLPFTYAIRAFRSTIAGGTSITGSLTVLAIISVVFMALTIGYFEIFGKKEKVEELEVVPEM